ncbi:hypothetical protein RD792_007935 [Penstemon davidsonii]|uniref:Uncharacterized protein n=1 Tax=Penstemon davidsonii TaxID=160366 RepID=A0ABR0D7W2_9LAMI|nr:hypothetical protein RD792_007935 [Penstemon davidsonii]
MERIASEDSTDDGKDTPPLPKEVQLHVWTQIQGVSKKGSVYGLGGDAVHPVYALLVYSTGDIFASNCDVSRGNFLHRESGIPSHLLVVRSLNLFYIDRFVSTEGFGLLEFFDFGVFKEKRVYQLLKYLYMLILEMGMGPNEVTLVSILSACIETEAFFEEGYIHGMAVKTAQYKRWKTVHKPNGIRNSDKIVSCSNVFSNKVKAAFVVIDLLEWGRDIQVFQVKANCKVDAITYVD